jgi:hypothetical protein
MNRFANLADKPRESGPSEAVEIIQQATTPPSRVGRKAISGYFSPELSLALHHCARRHELSLQALMAEAFNDVLRKYGESPVGE